MKKSSEQNFHLNYNIKRTLIILFSIALLLLIFFFKETTTYFRVFVSVLIVFLFFTVDKFFQINFRKRHYAYVITITIVGIIMSPLCYVYPNFDKIQHFVNPIMISSIVMYMISRLKLDLKWKLIFTFFVAFAILGLFEIGEFILDSFFGFKLQGVYLKDISGEKFSIIMEPIKDTMIDLVLGLLGILLYCASMIIFFKSKSNQKIFNEK